MPVIKIKLNTSGKPSWKLAEATLIFTPDDGPLLDGLELGGFTIGTSKFPGSVNVTVPSRKYLVRNTETNAQEERTWNYLRPVSSTDKDSLPRLLKAISDAYDDVELKTKPYRPEELMPPED